MTNGRNVVFSEDSIHLENEPNSFVMMSWENELMFEHSKVVCQNGGHILEIGFGMGIFANYVQSFSIQSHTIVEVNPQIYEKLKIWSESKENVRVIYGDWYKIYWKINQHKYDGIFYDADCDNISFFREKVVDRSLSKNGVFSYFDPKGRDRYKYGDRLHQYIMNITCDIPTNTYHNSSDCYVNYVKYL
jgi:protein arginine N-methyltransferase 2